MQTRDWEQYFEQNRRDRRPISWSDPVSVPATARAALAGLAGWLARVERRDARRIERWMRGGAVARVVAEKRALADLWERLRVRLAPDSTPDTGYAPEVLTGPWSVTAAVARAAILMRLCGALRAATRDAGVIGVCEQALHDVKFHVRFLCEQRPAIGRVVLWGLAIWAGGGIWWRHWRVLRKLGLADRGFAPGCWANVAAVEAAVRAGRPFTRGAAEQWPAWAASR